MGRGTIRWRRLCVGGVLALTVAACTAQPAPPQGDFGRKAWIDHALQGKIYFLPPNTQKLPDFKSLSPVGAVYARTLNVPTRDWQEGFPGVTDRFEWFAIEYAGRIRARQGGDYQLRVTSDDGARVFIDDKLIVDNDGVHPPTSASGSVRLDNSPHTIRVQYFQGPRTQVALQLYCTPKGAQEQLFPDCGLDLDTPRPWPWWLWLALVAAAAAIAYGLRRRMRRAPDQAPLTKNSTQ